MDGKLIPAYCADFPFFENARWTTLSLCDVQFIKLGQEVVVKFITEEVL